MKQNLQTPATPLEMLSLFLPAGLLIILTKLTMSLKRLASFFS